MIDSRLSTLGQLWKTGELPVDYMLRICADLDVIKKDIREFFEKGTDIVTISGKKIGDGNIEYKQLLEREMDTSKLYAHIHQILTNLGENVAVGNNREVKRHTETLTRLAESEKLIRQEKIFFGINEEEYCDLKTAAHDSLKGLNLEDFYTEKKIEKFFQEKLYSVDRFFGALKRGFIPKEYIDRKKDIAYIEQVLSEIKRPVIKKDEGEHEGLPKYPDEKYNNYLRRVEEGQRLLEMLKSEQAKNKKENFFKRFIRWNRTPHFEENLVMKKIFNDQELYILETLKQDNSFMTAIQSTISEHNKYKEKIYREFKIIKKSWNATLEGKDIKEYETVKEQSIKNIRELIREYEGREQIRPKELFYGFILDSNSINVTNYKYSFRIAEEEMQTDTDLNLKILHIIKKSVSDKKGDREFSFKIQELEKIVVENINYARDYSKRGENIPEREKLIFRTMQRTTLEGYDPAHTLSFDCLDFNGKYEAQGLTFLNNKYNTTLNIIREHPVITNPHTIGRTFLYDAEIDGRKTLFVAGFSGNFELDEFSNWTDTTIKNIIEFAKNNHYENISFNINPMGDIRNPSTKYSHEFAKALAKACNIHESEYSYKKLGSGRKPRFFQLTNEAKNKYGFIIDLTTLKSKSG